MGDYESSGTTWYLAEKALAVWLAFYTLVFVSSEVLSAFGLFRPRCIQAMWFVISLGIGCVVWFKRVRLWVLVAEVRQAIRWPRTFIGQCILVTGTLTLVNAVLAPSSEQDALVYHLPRASHWLSNGSIAFYETAVARQNFQAPGFSMCVAQLMALCGNDRLVNLLQWGAWWMFAAVAGLAAGERGGGGGKNDVPQC